MSKTRIVVKSVIVAVLLAVGAFLWLRPSETADELGATADAVAVSSPVDALAWLAGCWKHEEPGFRRDEQWMRPSGGTMIGMSRSVAEERTVEHEYLRIEVRGERLAYVANPSGQAEAVFLQAEITDRMVAFEAPGHDFPQKIVYERMSPRSIVDGVERSADMTPTRIR
jgi:hypothetical protein